MSAIFPNFYKDAESRIFAYMDPRSLMRLSGMNQAAHKILCNGKFFQQLFIEQYPLLAKTNQVFGYLHFYYSECSWKIACCVMKEEYTPFTSEFLERRTPFLKKLLKWEKEQIKGFDDQLVDCARRLENLKRTLLLWLLPELYFAKHLEYFVSRADVLHSINQYFIYQGAEGQGARKVKDLAALVRYAINHENNSCPLVWEILYHCCGNKSREKNWAEEHLEEFLPELRSITMALYKASQSHFDLALQGCVDENFISFQENLNDLQETHTVFLSAYKTASSEIDPIRDQEAFCFKRYFPLFANLLALKDFQYPNWNPRLTMADVKSLEEVTFAVIQAIEQRGPLPMNLSAN